MTVPITSGLVACPDPSLCSAVGDGNPVATWVEGASLNNAITAAGAARPTYRATGLGTQPGLEFNGTANAMTSAFTLGTGAFTLFVPFRMLNPPNAAGKLFSLKSGNGGEFLIQVTQGAGGNGPSPYFGFRTRAGVLSGTNMDGYYADAAVGNPGLLTVVYDGVSPDAGSSWACYAVDRLVPTVAGSSIGGGNNATAFGTSSGGDGPVNAVFGELPLYSRALAASEIVQVWDYYKGLGYGITGWTTTIPQFVSDGNSLTSGSGASDAAHSYPSVLQGLLGGPLAWSMTNLGVPGQTTEAMLADAAAQVDPLVTAFRPPGQSVCIAWEGINSLNNTGDTAAQAYSALTTYVHGRRAAGYKVIVCTTLPYAGATSSTTRPGYNALVLANSAGADRVVDLAGDSRLSDNTNLTYFNPDRIHLTDAGYAPVAELLYPEVLAVVAPVTFNAASSFASQPVGMGIY